uniref:TolC family protein n=1 Tax=Bordetella sputigena TaxID=1416810 RepID=UPI0039EFC8BB
MPAAWLHDADRPAAANGNAKAGRNTGAFTTQPAAATAASQAVATPVAHAAPHGDAWWQNFGDEALDKWVEAVLEGNGDLALAALQARREQLQAGVADGQRLPGVEARLERSISGGAGRRGHERKSAGARLSVSYDLDLWGRLEHDAEAAHWRALAKAEDHADVARSQSYLAARLYWELGYLNQRIDRETDNVASARQVRDLVAARHAAGASVYLDVVQSEQTWQQQEAALSDLLQQRVEARDRLAVLRGAAPASIYDEPTTLPAVPPPGIRAGLPVEVLATRPDVRAREARLRAALADADAARAALYPSITLTGALGGASRALADVIGNPARSLAAAMTLPFLEWRERRLKVGISETDYEERVVQFRDTLYKALAEVEDLLSAETRLRRSHEALYRARQAARQAADLMHVRYEKGAAYLQQWLDAQEKWRNVSSAYDDNHFQRLLNRARLYLALGTTGCH